MGAGRYELWQIFNTANLRNWLMLFTLVLTFLGDTKTLIVDIHITKTSTIGLTYHNP